MDWRLARALAGHEVLTARQLGWTAIQNGELLALAATAFDVFVTVDSNLAFQQNAATLPMPIIVLSARTNRLADLMPLVPRLLETMEAGPAAGVTIAGL